MTHVTARVEPGGMAESSAIPCGRPQGRSSSDQSKLVEQELRGVGRGQDCLWEGEDLLEMAVPAARMNVPAPRSCTW